MSFGEWIIYRTCGQTMHYGTCTMISSVDLAHYGLKIWVSGDCGTRRIILMYLSSAADCSCLHANMSCKCPKLSVHMHMQGVHSPFSKTAVYLTT